MKDIKEAVRDRYAEIAAAGGTGGSCCSEPSCCANSPAAAAADQMSGKLGYSEEELSSAPVGANLGLGCGNPQAIAALKPGETVLDLGSGGGFDCFLAARQVGESGQVIGVDMTPEMIDRARENARKSNAANVEFRLGEIEHLPVADTSVDVVISNCVINLSPDKPAVYREAFRVLRPGGRIAISDVVATAPLPAEILADVEMHVGCISGAATIEEVNAILTETGFTEICVTPKEESRSAIREWMPESGIENYVVSATIEAVRP